MNKNITRIINKVTSARWLVCTLLTIAFVYMAFTGRVTTEFLSVYTLVVTYYFTRNDRNKA